MTMHAIIPQPVQVVAGEGCFILSPQTQIVSDPVYQAEADYLVAQLRASTGFPMELAGASQNISGDSLIHIGRMGDSPEAIMERYRLEIQRKAIRLESASAAGVFAGIQTLLQLFPPAIYSSQPRNKIEWLAPCLTIDDYPRFAWRGAMLDCARYFRPVSFIKRFIDLMAIHKLNVFHWHLTDDQGWRIEIRKYPRLTECGAWRRETIRGHLEMDLPGDGTPCGGYYKQDEIREVVRYAAARHITVVPEIEMPGHGQAAIAAYPELGCTGEPVEPWTRWGISKYIYNPSERVIGFLQDVLEEVLQLFPSPFIHIGGDEAAKQQWDASPEVQARIAQLGVRDSHGLQSYFVRRMDEFLAERGRRLIGWDEILEGGLAPGAAVMSWRGIEGGVVAARAGHDVVMAPMEFTYLDYYQSQDLSSEPLALGGTCRWRWCTVMIQYRSSFPLTKRITYSVSRRSYGPNTCPQSRRLSIWLFQGCVRWPR